ncbi:MAG: ATP-binding protein [Pyrinomonadaceae bacterium]
MFVSATRPEAHRFAVIIRDEGERIADPSTVFESMDAMEPGAAGTNLNELGLSIARRLVDALGGRMRLESAGECGLSVCLDFPASL